MKKRYRLGVPKCSRYRGNIIGKSEIQTQPSPAVMPVAVAASAVAAAAAVAGVAAAATAAAAAGMVGVLRPYP